MQIKQGILIWILACTLSTIPAPCIAEELTLKFPSGSISQHEYFFELLSLSLKEAGEPVTIIQIKDMPHLRIRYSLIHGDISILWLIRSQERDDTYLPVPVNLTNGLIGNRILLIPPGEAYQYKSVKNLNDFRDLGKTGGFGTHWYDTVVWNTNKLPYKEIADRNLIYGMVASRDRGIDYFSRGLNEVVNEQKEHPELEIEPNLVLVYDRDFIFYVTPKRPDLVPILTRALTKAKESGLIDRLIKKHWGKTFKTLTLEKRTIIHLATPH